jgi:hypothetical protein
MKCHIYIAILLAGCLLVAMPAFAGNIYLTGHDLDFHCATHPAAPTSCNAFKIAFNLARAGAPNPTKPVLFLDQGCPTLGDVPVCTGYETELAAINAGIPATSYTVVNPATGFAALTLTTSNYSAIVFASDTTCGGCDNDVDGETDINNRREAIASFFNSGGGLVYLSGADSFIYYDSVPNDYFVFTVPGQAFPYALTPAGQSLGLTLDDANCCATHNSFVPTGFEGGSSAKLTVAELDANTND